MPSPRPLPTNLKVLRGTAQPCRINDKEPRPKKLKTIRPPSYLTKEEKQCWKKTVVNLQEAGIVTIIDVTSLAAYCKAWVGYQKESGIVEEKGSVVEGSKKTPVLSPHFKAANEYFKRLLQLWREFGMTPSSRSRIRADIDKPQDEFEDWQKKRRMAREGV